MKFISNHYLGKNRMHIRKKHIFVRHDVIVFHAIFYDVIIYLVLLQLLEWVTEKAQVLSLIYRYPYLQKDPQIELITLYNLDRYFIHKEEIGDTVLLELLVHIISLLKSLVSACILTLHFDIQGHVSFSVTAIYGDQILQIFLN